MNETVPSLTHYKQPDVAVVALPQELLKRDDSSQIIKMSGNLALADLVEPDALLNGNLNLGNRGSKHNNLPFGPNIEVGVTREMSSMKPAEVQSTMELRNHLDTRNKATVKIIERGVGEVTNLIASSDPQKSLLERKFGKNAHETLELIRQDTLSRIAKPMSERSGTGVFIEGEAELRRPIMDITLDDETSKVVADQLSKRKTGMVEVQKALNELLVGDTTDKKTFDVKLQSIINHKNGLLVRCGVQPREFGENIEGLNQRGNVADLYISENDMLEYDKLDELVTKATDLVYGKIDRPSSRDNIAARITQMATVTFPSGVEFMHRTPIETFPMIAQQNQLSTRSMTMHGVSRKTQNNGSFLHFTPPGTSAEEYGEVMIGVPIDTIYKYSPRLHPEDAYQNNSFYHEGAFWSTQEILGSFTINDPGDDKRTPLAFRVALANMRKQILQGTQRINIGQGKYDNFGFAATNNEKTAGTYAYPLSELHVYSDNPSAIDRAIRDVPSVDKIYSRLQSVVAMDDGGHRLPHGERYASLPNFKLDNSPLVVYAPVNREEVPFVESNMLGNDYANSSLPLVPATIHKDAYPKFAGVLIENGYNIDEVLDSVAQVVNAGVSYSVNDILKAYTDNRKLFSAANKDVTEVIKRFEVKGLLDVLHKIGSEHQDAQKVADIHDDSVYVHTPGSGMTVEERNKLAIRIADQLRVTDVNEFYKAANLLESAGYDFTPEDKQRIEDFRTKERALLEKNLQAFMNQNWQI